VACNYGDDSEKALPRFALAAGQNIMIGQYQSRFHSEIFQASPSRALPIPSDLLTRTDFKDMSPSNLYGFYHDPGKAIDGVVTPFWVAANDGKGFWFSFAMEQIAFFNEVEYQKAKANSAYRPRFYRMRTDTPVFRCATGFGKAGGCDVYWKENSVRGSTAVTEVEASMLARATVMSLSPNGSWLATGELADPVLESELWVRNAWANAIEKNASHKNKPLQLDGILYSSNAIFAIAPASSAIAGSMIVNGSLIAADTGILVPGEKGLDILYDPRLEDLLDFNESENIVLKRSAFQFLPVAKP
jgi:hypothetical protein